MKIASAIKGGLAGVTTLSLLGETLQKMDGTSAQPTVFNGKKLKKRFKKAKSGNGAKATQEYIRLAGDLLGSTGFFSFSGLGKKKNAVLRGAILGTAAGLGAVLVSERNRNSDGLAGAEGSFVPLAKNRVLSQALQVGLFALGGAAAGKLLKGKQKKKRKK